MLYCFVLVSIVVCVIGHKIFCFEGTKLVKRGTVLACYSARSTTVSRSLFKYLAKICYGEIGLRWVEVKGNKKIVNKNLSVNYTLFIFPFQYTSLPSHATCASTRILIVSKSSRVF